jgi:signal transduction histidine kinase
MIESSSAAEILSALGLAVFQRNDDGSFTLVSEPPDWSWRFAFPKLVPLSRQKLTDVFPLLDTFLCDADEFWGTAQNSPLESGPWTQKDAFGQTCTLQASAISPSSQPFLLLGLPGRQFEESRVVLQAARDQAVRHGRMERQVQELAEAKTGLESRNREIERVNRLKGEFLASMSHELRTPLNAIIGFSTLLVQEKAGNLNDQQKRFVGEIGHAADHLLRVINDILDISRIEAGRLQLQPEAFTLGEGLGEVLSAVEPLAAAKRIEIQAAEAASDLPVFADRVRFKQILFNLLSNAIKFTPKRGRVCVAARSSGEEIEVEVSDNGPGIPLEEQDRIFESFYQVARTGFNEGTGLGLAITSRLIEQHGGRIRVESTPGNGSRFSFTLPSGVVRREAGAADGKL